MCTNNPQSGQDDTLVFVGRFLLYDVTFHTLIVEHSGNKKLQEMCHLLVNHMLRYRMRSVSQPYISKRSLAEQMKTFYTLMARVNCDTTSLLAKHNPLPQRV